MPLKISGCFIVMKSLQRFLFAVCALSSTLALGQILSGRVTDDHGAALRSVNVSLPALHRGVATDSTGRFRMTNLQKNIYAVEFSMIGYRDETRMVDCSYDNANVDVVLHPSPFQMPSLTVTATAQPMELASTTLPTTIIEGRDMEIARGQSLMGAMLDAPGVNGFSRGPGTSKPVLRGLMGDRVLVLSDGVRQEGQTWDDEYSPEIDAFDLDRIEIVRGPGSVLYGADALGGVINVVRPELQSADEGAPMLQGIASVNAFTNNSQIAGAVSLSGATNNLAYRGHVTYRNAGDFNTPGGKVGGGDTMPKGPLTNTGETEFNASATAGINRSWGSLTLDLTHVAREQNLHGDPDSPDSTATPFQQISHERAHLKGVFPIDPIRLEADVSVQLNGRKEFETRVVGDPDAVIASVNLALTTFSAEVKAHHALSSALFGTGGVSFASQSNTTSGVHHLIPGFDQSTMALFLMENLRLGDLTLLFGGRLDTRSLKVGVDDSLAVKAQTHDYSAATGTIGAAWHIAGPLSLGMNLGTAWRSPSASELFINGPDEGIVRYKIGDPSMAPEKSLNLDASVRLSDAAYQFEGAVFRNTISKFIYLVQNGLKDSASGFDEYKYTQGDATMTGVEADLRVRVLPWLLVTAGADMVHASLDSLDAPVPLTPATRVRGGVRLVQPELWGMTNPYLSFTVRHTNAQDRIGPFEEATPAYTLFSAGCGAEIPVAGTTAHVDLAVENLTDVAYFDHLSRYKDFSLDPGRNIVLRVSAPFMIVR